MAWDGLLEKPVEGNPRPVLRPSRFSCIYEGTMSFLTRKLHDKLDLIISMLRSLSAYTTATGTKIMVDLTALTAAVGTLTTNIGNVGTAIAANDTEIQKELGALKTALAGGDQAAIDSITANISSLSTATAQHAASIQAETAALAAAVAPPATPAA